MTLIETLAADTDAGADLAAHAAMIQSVVGSPVIAVGTASRRGGALRTGGRRTWPTLPSSVMLAVTPTHLHALSHDFQNGKTVVTGEVARWERHGLRARVHDTPAGKALFLALRDGTRLEFEPLWGDDIDHGLVAVLLHPVG